MSGTPPVRPVPAVGLDLLEIARLERALERRPRLAERLFTDAERAYAAARARPGQHLAARFCAKEAVAKALGLDRLELSRRGGDRHRRRADVALSGAAARRAAELGVEVRVSLTHTHRQAGAVAIIDSHDRDRRR